MELNLNPIATQCCVSARPFAEHDRVVCYLVREDNGLTGRRDLLEAEDANLPKPGLIYCRWVISYKPRRAGDNPDRALKLTAETLFLTLADPANPPSEANTPLLQFLALMLERKKVLKPRGVTADGGCQVYEHMREHRLYEVPIGTFDAEYFRNIQEQLGVLVGSPKPATPVAAAAPPVPAARAPVEASQPAASL